MRYLVLAGVLVAGFWLQAQSQDFAWQALGEETFRTNCSGCHGVDGKGLAASFPPHAGHLPNVVAKEEGRSYLIRVVLNGLQGEIYVLGKSYNSIMPSWKFLSDEAIAAVLNHELHSWGNEALLAEGFMPILPEEVAAERLNLLNASDVYALRETLALDPND